MRTELTARQEAFAVAIAGGMCQRAAYETAGYSVRGSAGSVDSKACRLAADDRVRDRVAALRGGAAEEAMWGLVEAAEALKSTLNIARAKVLASTMPDVAGAVPEDVPREATRAVLASVASLNKMFRVGDAADEEEGVTIVYPPDTARRRGIVIVDNI